MSEMRKENEPKVKTLHDTFLNECWYGCSLNKYTPGHKDAVAFTPDDRTACIQAYNALRMNDNLAADFVASTNDVCAEILTAARLKHGTY